MKNYVRVQNFMKCCNVIRKRKKQTQINLRCTLSKDINEKDVFF